MAGDVIPGADGARKVRWSRVGMGKLVYFSLTEQGTVILVMMYAKANQDDVAPGDIEKVV